MTQPAPRSPWKRVLWIGCGLALALGATITILVLLNWSSIKEFATETANTLSALSDVQKKLSAKFHAPLLQVKSKVDTRIEGSILSVEVVNAPFFDELTLGEAEGRLLAYDIASSARAALPPDVTFQHYEVIFIRSMGVGLTVSRKNPYSFPVSALGDEPMFFRSGTIEDDTIAGPLGADTQKYEAALITSNRCLESLRAGDMAAFYAVCGHEVRSKMDEHKFAETCRQAVAPFGEMRRFEPMQWKFAIRTLDARRMLVCTKIVEHEKAIINWNFTFDVDGPYQEVIGFQWAPRAVNPSVESSK